jgi:8-oxo-dGTP diphosphatase
MDNQVDIHKAGGVIIRNRQFLVTRSVGKDTFIAPGGKLEPGETVIQALQREIEEEIQVTINPTTLESIGTFRAIAAGKQDVIVEMEVFLINDIEGDPQPSSEVEEIRWIDSQTKDIKLGSIFEHDVMPILKNRGLIN